MRFQYIALVALALGTSAALAQPNAVDFGAGWPPPEGAGCNPSKADTDRAHALYEQGSSAHKRGDYSAALIYYRDAYMYDCNAHVLLSNMAKVLESDGHYDDAAKLLRLFIVRVRPTGQMLTTIDLKIKNLESRAQRQASAEASASSALPLPVAAAPLPPASAQPQPLPSSPPPEMPERSSSRWIAWPLMGVGVAAMAVGGVMTISGQSQVGKIDDLHDQVWGGGGSGCSSPSCPADLSRANQDRDSAVAMRNAGVVVLGVGAATAAAALVWYLVGGRHSETAAGRPTVALAPGAGWLEIRGAF